MLTFERDLIDALIHRAFRGSVTRQRQSAGNPDLSWVVRYYADNFVRIWTLGRTVRLAASDRDGELRGPTQTFSLPYEAWRDRGEQLLTLMADTLVVYQGGAIKA